MIEDADKDGVEGEIHSWASVFGATGENFYTLEPTIDPFVLAEGPADHYHLRGDEYDEAVEALSEAVSRSGVETQ